MGLWFVFKKGLNGGIFEILLFNIILLNFGNVFGINDYIYDLLIF